MTLSWETQVRVDEVIAAQWQPPISLTGTPRRAPARSVCLPVVTTRRAENGTCPIPALPVWHVPSHRQAERSCRANPCEGLSPPLYGRSSPSLHNRLQTGCGPRGAFARRERPVTRERHMLWAGCLADPVA